MELQSKKQREKCKCYPLQGLPKKGEKQNREREALLYNTSIDFETCLATALSVEPTCKQGCASRPSSMVQQPN